MESIHFCLWGFYPCQIQSGTNIQASDNFEMQNVVEFVQMSPWYFESNLHQKYISQFSIHQSWQQNVRQLVFCHCKTGLVENLITFQIFGDFLNLCILQ